MVSWFRKTEPTKALTAIERRAQRLPHLELVMWAGSCLNHASAQLRTLEMEVSREAVDELVETSEALQALVAEMSRRVSKT